MSKNICRMTLLLFLCGLIFMFTDAPVSFSAEEVSVAFSSNRTSFLRMEENINLNVSVKNQGILPLSGMSLQVEMGGGKAIIPIPFANSGSLKYKLDTTVPAGTYDLTARVVDASGKAYSNEGKFTVVIVKRPLPSRMSLTMWGGGDSTFGFTHTAIFDTHWHSRPYFTSEVWANRKPVAGANQQHEVSAGFYTPDKIYDRLNDGLVNGMGYYVQTTPMRWIGEAKKEFNRIDRSGKPYAYENTCCLMPGLEEYCYNVGASVAQTYGEFPALQAALIHSEVRDSTQLCFHEEDKAAFKKFSGFDIPDAAVTASGVRGLPGLPSDRIIPDDNPILTYYKWFWKEGDGWNRIHTATSKGLKSTGRSDLWTFFDPAVRAPSIYGSGGEVDIVSSWYYTYPDPINIGMMTDELFALARGSANPNQKVMAMTQIIWYRSGVAPIGRTGKDGYKAEWEAREPEAAFITIAPDHLKIAFWSKIARPVQGIMYHGWGSLVAGEQGGYRYTNPETQNTLRTLVKEVLQPLGPTLMQVPERKTDVAFLESFTSQMLAGRGTHGGGGGWGGDSYLVLLYAQLQPEIVYEEEIAKKGLDKYKVLVMTDCDYLPRSVADKVLQFQGRGGIIIGDERLAPAISPD
ncbi:MAG: hypothetical protein NTY10_05405, partial [Candidatus Omnitrophica bacterium]|nr:hypothetical protein [Candidatus Omnitrophota bacterium]